MDMWVGARSAWHSKSLERRSSTYVSGCGARAAILQGVH